MLTRSRTLKLQNHSVGNLRLFFQQLDVCYICLEPRHVLRIIRNLLAKTHFYSSHPPTVLEAYLLHYQHETGRSSTKTGNNRHLEGTQSHTNLNKNIQNAERPLTRRNRRKDGSVCLWCILRRCWYRILFVTIIQLTFKRRIKYRLPFAGIIRSSPYSPRFQDNG